MIQSPFESEITMENKQADEFVKMLDEIADGLAQVVDAMPYYDPDQDGSALEVCGVHQKRQVEVLRDISETLG
jgi:dsDNA-binding SOS-regulon protein